MWPEYECERGKTLSLEHTEASPNYYKGGVESIRATVFGLFHLIYRRFKDLWKVSFFLNNFSFFLILNSKICSWEIVEIFLPVSPYNPTNEPPFYMVLPCVLTISGIYWARAYIYIPLFIQIFTSSVVNFWLCGASETHKFARSAHPPIHYDRVDRVLCARATYVQSEKWWVIYMTDQSSQDQLQKNRYIYLYLSISTASR